MSDMNTPEVPAEAPVAEVAPEQTETQAPAPVPATPVLVQQPSSASPTQQPETAPAVEPERLSVKDAAERVIELVESHRTIGDGDLAAAVEQLRVAVADEEQDAEEA